MSKLKKPIVAICYDFDGTLSPQNMQEATFIPQLGVSPEDFWKESNNLAKSNQADPILSYMKLMIDKATSSQIPIKKTAFKEYGQKVELYLGVKDWFDRIKTYGLSKGISIEHYIISSGLKEMIEGSEIRKKIKKIYASSFFYDVNDVAKWPSNAVNYTTKTQYLFRINKGITDSSDNILINKFTPDTKRRVPFSRMIYIGDGETDVPCMRLVKEKGGQSIAVYKTRRKQISQELLRDGRVNFIAEANYTKGSSIDIIVKTIIDKIEVNNRLDKLIACPRKRSEQNNVVTATTSSTETSNSQPDNSGTTQSV